MGLCRRARFRFRCSATSLSYAHGSPSARAGINAAKARRRLRDLGSHGCRGEVVSSFVAFAIT